MKLIVTPDELSNRQFLVQEGRLQFFAAHKSVFVVGAYDAKYQVCQIIFNKSDGSIFMSTPYFGGGMGVVASATARGAGPATISFAEKGKVTSHLVKLSHHPDGRVHFSQTGKVWSTVGTTSFKLPSEKGEVFELHIYHPAGFEALTLANRDHKRAYLPVTYTGELPRALTLAAEWRTKESVLANTIPAGGTVNAVTSVVHRKSGVEKQVMFLGQPEGWPLRDHVLMLSCHPTQPLPNITRTTMILLGGWGPMEEEVGVPSRKLLTWIYPHENAEELAARIGSIDLTWPKPND